MRPSLGRLFSTLICLAALFISGCGEQQPLKIGFVAGLSGRVADLGIAGRNGVILALEQRNAQGGIDGRPIVLDVRDDAQDSETAQRVVAELLQQDVEAIIGPMTSSIAMAVVPLINDQQVVMVSPTVTTAQLTGLDDHFIRVIRDTDTYGRRSAEHRYQKLGLRRIVAVYDQRNAAYTESWLASFKDHFERQGGKVISAVGFQSGDDVHFHQLAQQLIDPQPDAIQIISSAMDAALLIQQIRKLAPGVPVTTSEWAATEKLIELGGDAVEGVSMAQFFDRSSTLPSYVEFKQAFQQRFSQEPGFAEIGGYDAAQVVLTALAERQPGESLKQAILRVRTFAGAQGRFEIDQYGDTNRGTFMTEVKHGKFRVVE